MKRRIIVVVLASVLLVALVPTPSAKAWPWSGSVTVAGFTRCQSWWNAYTPSRVSIRLDNGATASAVPNGITRWYSIRFTGVPSSIGATVTVSCGMTGNWTRRVTIYRPTVGDIQYLTLNQF